jgi:hypothetical protein
MAHLLAWLWRRAGIRRVVLPKNNEMGWRDVPDDGLIRPLSI